MIEALKDKIHNRFRLAAEKDRGYDDIGI